MSTAAYDLRIQHAASDSIQVRRRPCWYITRPYRFGPQARYHTTVTGTDDQRTTVSATLLSRTREMPSRPWLPMTTWSKPSSSAYLTMVRANLPTSRWVSMSTPASSARSVADSSVASATSFCAWNHSASPTSPPSSGP